MDTIQYPKRVYQAIRSSTRPGETPVFYLRGSGGQALVGFADRVLIAKAGWLAGALFGCKATVFYFHDVVGIEVRNRMNGGSVEILSAGYPPLGEQGNAWHAPNALPFGRGAYEQLGPYVQRLRDLIAAGKGA